MNFYNSNTGHRFSVSAPWLWAFLFGAFYYIFHGIWTHAVIYVGLAIVTGGLAAPFLWVGYSVAASSILVNHYALKGYSVVYDLHKKDVVEGSVD
ncbi:MAG: DUF2628 domain-containing protein [Flavobacteriaceae bacterium]